MSRHILGAVGTARARCVSRSSRLAFAALRLASFDGLLAHLLFLGVTCFSLGCAVQGPPLPPRVDRPEQVKDLAVIQRGQSLVFSFTLPELATDGERLSKPLEVEIFRTVTPRGAPLPDQPSTDAPWVTLPADDIRRLTVGQKVVYSARLADQEFSASRGVSFTFGVRALTRGFRRRAAEGELSNVARATLLDVSGPVENLRVQATEKALELEWSPPARSLTGGPLSTLVGYRVYRSATGEAGSFALRAETDSPTYGDPGFQFDRSYYYKVQAVFKGNSSVAESEDSAPLEITPHDVFPPAAPKNVTAIYAAGAVELVWTASTEPDLAGYNVTRREGSGPAERINPELSRTPIFRDARVLPDRQYFYRVTAVDLSRNESPASAEVEVETR